MNRSEFYISKKDNFIQFLKKSFLGEESDPHYETRLTEIEKFSNMDYADLVNFSLTYLKPISNMPENMREGAYETAILEMLKKYNINPADVSGEQFHKIKSYLELFSTI